MVSPQPLDTPEPLRRLDSFPYRHRLSEVMSSPAVMLPPTASLADAAGEMDRRRISSIVVSADGLRASGILTERDVLTAVAAAGGPALARPLADFMTASVETLPPDAMVYQALGRMDRLGIRHLVIAGPDGGAVGMVTARALLKQRAGTALALGDEISVAADAEALGAVRQGLAELARGLLAEQVLPVDVAAVISDVMRGLTARAAALAEAAMAGPPPAPYCVLILGSGGRGESLLAPDQDNALIHAGGPLDDVWFAAFAEHMTRILDEAGVPYCQGGVMASRPIWRHGREGWREQVAGWVATPKPEALLSVDIFYDFQPVWGDSSLAEELRRQAQHAAAGSMPFLKALAGELDRYRPPIGLFGRFRADHGRVDLKIGGLFPIVAGARTLALRYGVADTATANRLEGVHRAGHLGQSDLRTLILAHQAILGAILRQQIEDLAAGLAPGSRVDVRRMDADARAVLASLVRRLDVLPEMVRGALVG